MKIPALAVTTIAALTLVSCGDNTPSYSTRMTYLETLANRGVQFHVILTGQRAKIDSRRCAAGFEALTDPHDLHDIGDGQDSDVWANEKKQFFVDSCVSGFPKPLPGATSGQPGTPTRTPGKSPSPGRPTKR